MDVSDKFQKVGGFFTDYGLVPILEEMSAQEFYPWKKQVNKSPASPQHSFAVGLSGFRQPIFVAILPILSQLMIVATLQIFLLYFPLAQDN
jgi:hypothetical protein